MNAEQLKTILTEYPPTRKLNVIVDGRPAWETTVSEIVLRLGREPENTLVTLFGRDSCIIRERVEDLDAPPGASPIRKWLEIDVR